MLARAVGRRHRVFWVPREARWLAILAGASHAGIAKRLDDAMGAIESDNRELRQMLPRVYSRAAISAELLGSLVETIAKIGFGDDPREARDILGRTYEYFIKEFARAEGHRGGEFFTPAPVARLLVEMLEPLAGRVFDPACGSCGLFVQSARFVEAHGGRPEKISIYGQERNQATWRIGAMNLAIHGLSGEVKYNEGGSLLTDAFPSLRADFVMANPPFNQREWSTPAILDDVRWGGWGMRCELPEGWIRGQLGDHVDVLVGFAFRSAQFTDDSSDIRLLRGDNVGQGRLRWHSARRWPANALSDFKRYTLEPHDVVLAMDRPWIEAGLKYAVVRKEDVPCLLVQRVSRLRGTATLIQRYLPYVIGDSSFTRYVLSSQTGTAVPHISASQITAFSFVLPPIVEQRRIADVLCSLDDKIDSNRRVVSLLGQISGALFVSLDAAATKTMALGEVVDVIDCLHSKKPEQQAEGKLLLQLDNIRDDGLLDLASRFLVSEVDYKKWTRRIEMRHGDCVITNVGRVGAVARIPDIRAALGRNMTGLRCLPNWPFPTVLIEALMSSRMRRAIDELTDAGTVMNALNVRNIPRLPIPALSRDSFQRAEETLSTVWGLREALLRETRTYEHIRDALLPKLISGEIRVPDTADPEEVIGQAAGELAEATR